MRLDKQFNNGDTKESQLHFVIQKESSYFYDYFIYIYYSVLYLEIIFKPCLAKFICCSFIKCQSVDWTEWLHE